MARHGSFAYREGALAADEPPPSSRTNRRVLSALARLSAMRGEEGFSREFAERAEQAARVEQVTLAVRVRKQRRVDRNRVEPLRANAWAAFRHYAFVDAVRLFQEVIALAEPKLDDLAVLVVALRATGRSAEAHELQQRLLTSPFDDRFGEGLPANVAFDLGRLLLDLGDPRAHYLLEGAMRTASLDRPSVPLLDLAQTAADAAFERGAAAAALVHVQAALHVALLLDEGGPGFLRSVAEREARLSHLEGRFHEAENRFAALLRMGHCARLPLAALFLDWGRSIEADLLAAEAVHVLRETGFQGQPCLCPALRLRVRTLDAIGQDGRARKLQIEHDALVRRWLPTPPAARAGSPLESLRALCDLL